MQVRGLLFASPVVFSPTCSDIALDVTRTFPGDKTSGKVEAAFGLVKELEGTVQI